MRHTSRWQTAAILGVTLLVSLAALPNVLPASTLERLPAWAQRTFVLGYDLQGGSYVQFQVDADDVRQQVLSEARNMLRDTLRRHRVGFTGLAIRSDSVEARIRDPADIPRATLALEQLVGPLPVAAPTSERHARLVRHVDGTPSVWASRNASPPSRELKLEIVGQTVRLTPDDAAYRRRTAQAREHAVRRLDGLSERFMSHGLPLSVSRVGADRIEVVVPGLTSPRLLAHLMPIH